MLGWQSALADCDNPCSRHTVSCVCDILFSRIMSDSWGRFSQAFLIADGAIFAAWFVSFVVISVIDDVDNPIYRFAEKLLRVLAISAFAILYIGVAMLISACFR